MSNRCGRQNTRDSVSGLPGLMRRPQNRCAVGRDHDRPKPFRKEEEEPPKKNRDIHGPNVQTKYLTSDDLIAFQKAVDAVSENCWAEIGEDLCALSRKGRYDLLEVCAPPTSKLSQAVIDLGGANLSPEANQAGASLLPYFNE